MTQNPYVQMNQADDGGRTVPSRPARTSVLAILSLVFSLICCIPGMSALGLLFGGLAIIRIGMSGGRVRGLGLAITGVVLGLILTVIWIGSFAAASFGVGQFMGSADQTMAAIEAGDPQASRKHLSQTAMITDEQITAFKAVYSADYGTYGSVPKGMWAWGSGLMSGGADTQSAITAAQAKYPGQTAFPTPITFSSGTTMLVIFAESDDPTQIFDLGLVRADGSLYWLTDEPGSPDH